MMRAGPSGPSACRLRRRSPGEFLPSWHPIVGRRALHATPRTACHPASKGDKRTAQRVLAEIVGPSLRWATTLMTKTIRTVTTEDASSDVAGQEV